MFSVRSFLKKNDEFVHVIDYTGVIEDPDYIEGAIEIQLNDKFLLDCNSWDYVDQLWAYFVDGLVEVANGKEFLTYFPDQPIEVLFQPTQNNKQVNIKIKMNPEITLDGSVQYAEFMEVMTTAARTFFQQMAEIVPSLQDFYKSVNQKLTLIN